MAQRHQNNGRPRPRNNNHKAPRVSKWQDERQKEDDQIAPDGVSGSANQLQRWALMTANMPLQPTKRVKSRAIEEEIRERIQRRYQGPEPHRPATSQDDPGPIDHRKVVDLTGDDAQPQVLVPPTTMKRPYSPSPPRHSSRTDVSTVNYVQTTKRRRSRSPSPRRSAYSAFSTQTYCTRVPNMAGSDEDVDYAQSSEWSFPSSQVEGEEMG